MKKKILSTMLALCLVIGLLPTVAFAAGSEPFTDVGTADWFYDEVVYVYDNGLMAGTSDTTFTPDTTTTRGMLVTILYRLDGEPTVYAEGTFSDVVAGAYYAEAVEWAAANSIVGGYGNGLFGPNDPLTREQMAAILYRYAQYADVDVSVGEETNILSYADVADVSEYAIPAMQWACGAGVIGGTSATTLSPKGNATRAQVAVILYRFCEDVLASEDDAEKFTVTFEYNYGSKGTYETVTVEYGETVEKPSNPSRSGYSFSGWYTKATGGSKFDFDTAIDADLTLYAHWSSNSGGGSYTPHSHSYSYKELGDGTHSVACTSCSTEFSDEACTLGEYESNGAGSHTAECIKCGYEVTQTCYLENNDDSFRCATCGYEVKVDDLTPPEGEDTAAESYALAVGSCGYNGLSEAVAAAVENNDVIILLANLTLSDDVTINDPVTINLNGFDVNGSLTLSADVTLASNSEDGSAITASTDGDSAIVISDFVKLTIEGEITVTGATHGDGINVPAGSSLELTGGILTATSNSSNTNSDYQTTSVYGGSGIGNAGAEVGSIYIHNMESLTAMGSGKWAFGIGGTSDTAVKIENTTIEYVCGGFVQQYFESDADEYGSGDPEGGAAIGNDVILTNVTIVKAEGGSKSAAIGGQYWKDADIVIDGCNITAVGGNASAAIGGSRMYDSGNTIEIEITNSTINAVGGDYGAGIGSGYDVHCSGSYSVVIEISGSNVTATGGKYAAGIGTGYHVANLTGSITDSDINATAGNSRNDKYTLAQNVGYGVVDVAREAENLNVVFTVDGVVIDSPVDVNAIQISTAEELFAFAEAVNSGNNYEGKTVVLMNDIDLENKAWTPIGQTGSGNTWFKGVFDGNNHTIYNLCVDSSAQTDAHYASGLFGWTNGGATVKNLTVEDAEVTGHHYVAVIVGYAYATIENCHVKNANITCTHYDGDACGDKCGLIAGYVGEDATITQCTGSDSTVSAGRDAGQIVGAAREACVSDCSAENVAVSATGDCSSEANIAADIIGRKLY